MHERKDVKWQKNKLFCRGEDTGYSIVPHKKYKGMFYIIWPDEAVSKDFYNSTRAKENATKWFLNEKNDVNDILDSI